MKEYNFICPECGIRRISTYRVFRCPKCGFNPPINDYKQAFEQLMEQYQNEQKDANSCIYV